MAVEAHIDVHQVGVRLQPHFWSRPRVLLDDISFRVEAGEIFGFLGANGAGKTTTIKVILGLLTPTTGTVRLAGMPSHTPAARRSIGFMPERAYYPEHLSAHELVRLHGILAGLSRRDARHRAGEVLERVGLSQAMHDKLKNYSKGMLQRAGLAQALVGSPQIIIMDEPMSGLDPLGRRDVREIMLSLRKEGKTVFFSTHILPDIELLCDRVAMLAAGKLYKIGTLSDLVQHGAGGIEVEARGVSAPTLARLRTQAQRVNEQAHGLRFECANIAAANALIDDLRRDGALIQSVQSGRGSLEAAFVQTEKSS